MKWAFTALLSLHGQRRRYFINQAPLARRRRRRRDRQEEGASGADGGFATVSDIFPTGTILHSRTCGAHAVLRRMRPRPRCAVGRMGWARGGAGRGRRTPADRRELLQGPVGGPDGGVAARVASCGRGGPPDIERLRQAVDAVVREPAAAESESALIPSTALCAFRAAVSGRSAPNSAGPRRAAPNASPVSVRAIYFTNYATFLPLSRYCTSAIFLPRRCATLGYRSGARSGCSSSLTSLSLQGARYPHFISMMAQPVGDRARRHAVAEHLPQRLTPTLVVNISSTWTEVSSFTSWNNRSRLCRSSGSPSVYHQQAAVLEAHPAAGALFLRWLTRRSATSKAQRRRSRPGGGPGRLIFPWRPPGGSADAGAADQHDVVPALHERQWVASSSILPWGRWAKGPVEVGERLHEREAAILRRLASSASQLDASWASVISKAPP